MQCHLWKCVRVVAVSLCVVVALDNTADSNPVIVEANNSSFNVGEATETQQATCHIVTEKLAATASATVTRALKGVCSTSKNDYKYIIIRYTTK